MGPVFNNRGYDKGQQAARSQIGMLTILMASSIDMGEGDHTYSLHGSLTNTVVQTGRSLVVEDARNFIDYGKAPVGYWAYLGVPLRPSHGKRIVDAHGRGVIYSFIYTRRYDGEGTTTCG